MNAGWITAYEARALVSARRNAFTSAAVREVELAIIDNARTILPARCAFMRDKIPCANGAVDQQVDSRDTLVPCWAWDLTDDCDLNWVSGTFHLSGSHEGELRYLKLVGVRFDDQAIDEIWPALDQGNHREAKSGTAATATPKITEYKKGGAQPKLEAWHAFWLEAMKMLNEGELHDTKRFSSQSALQAELLRRVHDALSDASVKPLVRRIWHEFRE